MNRMKFKLRFARCVQLALALLCLVANSGAAVSAGTSHGNLELNGGQYPYTVFAPIGYTPTRPAPAILLVHGAGGNGPDFLKLWQGIAQKNGIILVAPTLPSGDKGAALESQVPQLFHALMGLARKQWNIDPRRIYLFGYSAGGYFTFDAAMLDSTYFAAAGVFAARITPEFAWIVQKAQRKTPIALYIGDHDQFFSRAQIRVTRDLLRASGFTVHYVEIINQDHNYPAVSDWVNQDAWTFMRGHSLPQ